MFASSFLKNQVSKTPANVDKISPCPLQSWPPLWACTVPASPSRGCQTWTRSPHLRQQQRKQMNKQTNNNANPTVNNMKLSLEKRKERKYEHTNPENPAPWLNRPSHPQITYSYSTSNNIFSNQAIPMIVLTNMLLHDGNVQTIWGWRFVP